MVNIPQHETPPGADNPVYRIRYEGKQYIQFNNNGIVTIPFTKETARALQFKDKVFRFYCIDESGEWLGPFSLQRWINDDIDNICPHTVVPRGIAS